MLGKHLLTLFDRKINRILQLITISRYACLNARSGGLKKDLNLLDPLIEIESHTCGSNTRPPKPRASRHADHSLSPAALEVSTPATLAPFTAAAATARVNTEAYAASGMYPEKNICRNYGNLVRLDHAVFETALNKSNKIISRVITPSSGFLWNETGENWKQFIYLFLGPTVT